MNNNKVKVFYPILFAILPVLTLYLVNQEQVRLVETIGSLLVIIGIVITLWAILTFALKNIYKSALIVTVSSFLFLYFIPLNIILYFYLYRVASKLGVQLDNPQLWFEKNASTSIYFFIFWGLLLVIFIFLVIRAKMNFKYITLFLNFLPIVLAAGVLINNGFQFFENKPFQQSDQPTLNKSGNNESLEMFNDSPDIYYIVLDGYGSQDILQELYKLDNSDFINFLKENNFYIADSTFSNYSQTGYSLYASLNYEYIEDPNYTLLDICENISDNQVFSNLRNLGYQIVVFDSGFNCTYIQDPDIRYEPDKKSNHFNNYLVNNTPLYYFARKSQYDSHRNYILNALENFDKVSNINNNQPKIVFAHIFSPHPPFVFGQNGEFLYPNYPFTIRDSSKFVELANQEEYIKGYRSQTIYITNKLKDMINQIMIDSNKEAIIIIQSDHGPGAYFNQISYQKGDYIEERFSILNAYYFPDGNYEKLYPTISPVNSFRVIFNQFFGGSYPVLSDNSYYCSIETPLQFIDVTNDLKR